MANQIINDEIGKLIMSGDLKDLWKLYNTLKIQFEELKNNDNINKVENGVRLMLDIRIIIYELNFVEDTKNEEYIIGDDVYKWLDVKKEIEDRESTLRNELMKINLTDDLTEYALGGRD